MYFDMNNGHLSLPWKESKPALKKPMTNLINFFHAFLFNILLEDKED